MGEQEEKGKIDSQALDALKVGHDSSQALTPRDEVLFRAFQSNLLSLISHELRTPLMGIQNALTIINAEKGNKNFSSSEWIEMAMQNAQRLNQALSGLLDRAAVDSQTFKANLTEIDFQRFVMHQVNERKDLLKSKELELKWLKSSEKGKSPLLADPQKLSRAIDLCLEAIIIKAIPQSAIKFRISLNQLIIQFTLGTEHIEKWRNEWSQSLIGLHSGVLSPHSAFAGVLQSEEAFLVRTDEGLGGELLLIHEIMKVHRGHFKCEQNETEVKLVFEFPELPPRELLQLVMSTRVEHLENELGSVSLLLWQLGSDSSLTEWSELIQKSLFRTTDAVYPLPDRHQLAIVVDHCKPEHLPKIVDRIQATMSYKLSGLKVLEKVPVGVAHCPSDGYDPEFLITLAEKRLACFEKLRYGSQLNS